MTTSCEFNIDTASVEWRFSDGDEIDPTIPMQTEIDWLIYNEPLTQLGTVGKIEINKVYEIPTQLLIQFGDSLKCNIYTS